MTQQTLAPLSMGFKLSTYQSPGGWLLCNFRTKHRLICLRISRRKFHPPAHTRFLRVSAPEPRQLAPLHQDEIPAKSDGNGSIRNHVFQSSPINTVLRAKFRRVIKASVPRSLVLTLYPRFQTLGPRGLRFTGPASQAQRWFLVLSRPAFPSTWRAS
jgi:hypothetical protein